MIDEADVLAVSAAWDAALIANDATGFAEFVTADWAYVGPAGATSRAVFVREGGRWRCVLSQKCPAETASPIPTG